MAQFDGNLSSPSRRARDGEASTKPNRTGTVGFAAAARFGAGSFLISSFTKTDALAAVDGINFTVYSKEAGS